MQAAFLHFFVSYVRKHNTALPGSAPWASFAGPPWESAAACFLPHFFLFRKNTCPYQESEELCACLATAPDGLAYSQTEWKLANNVTAVGEAGVGMRHGSLAMSLSRSCCFLSCHPFWYSSICLCGTVRSIEFPQETNDSM